MTTIIIFTAMWCLFASLDGFIQAYYYDLYPITKQHRNLHPFFTIVRAIVAAPMCYEVLMISPEQGWSFVWIPAAMFGLGLIMTFSFLHNGFYYMTRNKLQPSLYPKGFMDKSTSSTALMDLSFKLRTSLLIIGLAFIYGVILQIVE